MSNLMNIRYFIESHTLRKRDRVMGKLIKPVVHLEKKL
jgi:hypothetical protein